MTTSEQPRSTFPNQAEMICRWTALAEQSQQLVQAFTERQAEEGGFSIVDPQGVSRAFLDMMTRMMGKRKATRLFSFSGLRRGGEDRIGNIC